MAAAAEPTEGRPARRAGARRNVAATPSTATECLAMNPHRNIAEIAAAEAGRMTAEQAPAIVTSTLLAALTAPADWASSS